MKAYTTYSELGYPHRGCVELILPDVDDTEHAD